MVTLIWAYLMENIINLESYFRIVDFHPIYDKRGNLISLENSVNIPFDIKRVYYMYDTDLDFVRGKHAHKQLRQILICMHGSCKVTVESFTERKEIKLTSPSQGILMSGCVWREIGEFSEGSVVNVIADSLYDEADYIRQRQEFDAIKQEYLARYQ